MPKPPPEWLYVGAIVVALLVFRGMKRLFWLFSLLVLPGTFAHESLHYLTGLLLDAGPVSFNLWPRRDGQGWAMGSVTFNHIRWYNAFFVGMAPLLLLPAAYGLALWRLRGQPVLGWQEALGVYVVANFIYAALPSWADVKIAARSPIGWILLAGGLVWGWRILQAGAPPGGPGQVPVGSRAR